MEQEALDVPQPSSLKPTKRGSLNKRSGAGSAASSVGLGATILNDLVSNVQISAEK